MNWYYAQGSQQIGPVSEAQLASLVQQGNVKPEMLIWREGMPDWQPLARVRPDLAAAAGVPIVGGFAVTEQSKDLLVQQLREGASTLGDLSPYGMRYAGFWIRTGAKLIDGIIVTVVTLPVSLFILFSMGIFSPDFEKRLQEDPSAVGAFLGMYGLLFLFGIVFHIAYNGLLVWKWGGTPGKLAVGIKVVSQEGQPLSLGRAIGRAAADMINAFICNGITYLIVAFDEPQKRGLHDHIAGTRVVYK
ncbi:MAG: RDD family protein [Roseimicrobium sp.]